FSGRAGKVLGGWQLHGLLMAQTGPGFGPRVGTDWANLTQSREDLGQRPDFVGVPGDIILGDPQRYINPNAFALPERGRLGNLGRNAFTGPGLFALDASVHKDLWRSERHVIRLRVEAFNLTNRPNFQVPSELALFNSQGNRLQSAGRITSTTTTSRQLQLGVKWTF
ncbi:MAG: carboxypeptidase regulatory-like domain-containing protein, partial [bacterium]|nr:carboxypeptidase regulatory-like domain-containing protein [bacterium]